MTLQDIKIKMFPAKSGDCILIHFLNENFRILIDGGYGNTYDKYLKPYLTKLGEAGGRLNLVIATHIDRDHIGGIKRFLKDNGKADNPRILPVDNIWFNGFRNIPLQREENSDIPFMLSGVLQNMASNNMEDTESETENISYHEGNCLADQIVENGYPWNMGFNKAAAADDKDVIEYGRIRIHILSPLMEDLNRLAQAWVEELKETYNGMITISDNHLFDRAFEGCFLYDDNYDCYDENISDHISGKIDWQSEAEKNNEKPDKSPQNLSSIAVLIDYGGNTLLFPGDCPLYKIMDKLPEKINVVKLPHHGSGKSNTKEFIRSRLVNYYLVSTDGSYGHPSKMIIGNIICHAKGKPEIVTNYRLPELNDISTIMEEA